MSPFAAELDGWQRWTDSQARRLDRIKDTLDDTGFILVGPVPASLSRSGSVASGDNEFY